MTSPEELVCAKHFDFKYFSGEYSPASGNEKIAAKRVMEIKKINCNDRYLELLKINGNNALRKMDIDERRSQNYELSEKFKRNERDFNTLNSQIQQLEIKQKMDDALKPMKRY